MAIFIATTQPGIIFFLLRAGRLPRTRGMPRLWASFGDLLGGPNDFHLHVGALVTRTVAGQGQRPRDEANFPESPSGRGGGVPNPWT